MVNPAVNLHLLSGPRPGFPPCYRGVARFPLCHADELPDDAPQNRLFRWYLTVSDQSGVVHDQTLVSKLIQAADAFNWLRLDERYELVETVTAGRCACLSGELLGFDIAVGAAYSLLDGWHDHLLKRPEETDPAVTMAWLVRAHFRPLLNRHWLFDELETAAACCESMNALQSLAPGIHEYGRAAPLGVYLVKWPTTSND